MSTKPTQHIILTGPESSAKTDLAIYLSNELSGVLVKEYAREYLEAKKQPNYELEDVMHMAFVQFQKQLETYQNDPEYIFSDTGMLNYMVWTKYKYGFIPDQIHEWFLLQQSDLHLLCYPDLPWNSDPLRENPNDRMELFAMYENFLDEYKLPYKVIKGVGELRKKNALDSVFDAI